MDKENRKTIGLAEPVTLFGSNDQKLTTYAKIDTGATKSSIDIKLAQELNLGPAITNKIVKSAHGTKLRPIIKVKLQLKDTEMTSQFTVAERSHMKYKVLIGQNILKKHFIIDPSK